MDFVATELGQHVRDEFARLFSAIEDTSERSAVSFRVLVNLDPASTVNNGSESEVLRQLREWSWSGLGWSPEEVLKKSSEEMNPGKNERQRKLFQSRMNEKIQVEDNEIYCCRNKECRSRKVIPYEMQIARIDEPSNVKVYCTQCYSSYII